MRPKPPSLPFVVGTDIVHLPRIHRLLNINRSKASSDQPNDCLSPSHKPDKFEVYDPFVGFCRRLLVLPEWRDLGVVFKSQYAPGIRNSLNHNTFMQLEDAKRDRIVHYLGGRWAAKEAVRKAYGAENYTWHDVRVGKRSFGSVYCQLRMAGSWTGKEEVKGLLGALRAHGNKKHTRQLLDRLESGGLGGRVAGLQTAIKQVGKENFSGKYQLLELMDKVEKKAWWKDADEETSVVQCSISHDAEYVIATVLAPSDPGRGVASRSRTSGSSTEESEGEDADDTEGIEDLGFRDSESK